MNRIDLLQKYKLERLANKRTRVTVMQTSGCSSCGKKKFAKDPLKKIFSKATK